MGPGFPAYRGTAVTCIMKRCECGLKQPCIIPSTGLLSAASQSLDGKLNAHDCLAARAGGACL